MHNRCLIKTSKRESDTHSLPQRYKLSKLDSSDALGTKNGQEAIKEANDKLQTMEKALFYVVLGRTQNDQAL